LFICQSQHPKWWDYQEVTMAYETLNELPQPVRHVLPKHARNFLSHSTALGKTTITTKRVSVVTAVKRVYEKISRDVEAEECIHVEELKA
jgi:hypothetical protein